MSKANKRKAITWLMTALFLCQILGINPIRVKSTTGQQYQETIKRMMDSAKHKNATHETLPFSLPDGPPDGGRQPLHDKLQTR